MTEAEIRQAEKDAGDDAGALAMLLLLLLMKPRSPEGQRVRFDPAAGRFYFDGKTVSIRSIRAHLNRIEDRFGKKLAKMTRDLEDGRVTLAEWKRSFDRTVISSHILAGALALGGIAVAVRNSKVQSRIADELKFADEFSESIRMKKAGSFSKIRARAKSYLMAASVTYSQIEQDVRGLMGMQTEAKRIRRAAESCRGCIEYSYRWMLNAKLPPIGSMQCRQHCRCFVIYR